MASSHFQFFQGILASPPKSPSPKREGDLICCLISPSLLGEGLGRGWFIRTGGKEEEMHES